MSIKYASSFESLFNCINNTVLTMQQLLAISEQLEAASDQLRTDLTLLAP